MGRIRGRWKGIEEVAFGWELMHAWSCSLVRDKMVRFVLFFTIRILKRDFCEKLRRIIIWEGGSTVETVVGSEESIHS
jgi:hypothetical protein